jgi:uncharacterized protein (TIGR03643 family)
MGISSSRKEKWNTFPLESGDRIIQMALEDRTAFEEIKTQFGLGPNEVVLFMRARLSPAAFRRWRKRISNQGHLKNRNLLSAESGLKLTRFKSKKQRLEGSIKNRK